MNTGVTHYWNKKFSNSFIQRKEHNPDIKTKLNFNRDLFEVYNKESFKNMISYITLLKDDNVIDDDIFEKLVVLASSIYIENEIEKRIHEYVDNHSILKLFEGF